MCRFPTRFFFFFFFFGFSSLLPPFHQTFTSEAVQEELRVVALAFCELDENVLIDVARRTLTVSKIFRWYASDFGASNVDVAARVGSWLRGEKKDALEELLKGGRFKILSHRYDWTSNALPTAKIFGGGRAPSSSKGGGDGRSSDSKCSIS